MSAQQIALNIIIAFIQLLVGLTVAIGSVYMGIAILDKLTRDINEWKEIKKGNVAVGVLLAGIIISIALIVEQGVVDLLSVLSLGVDPKAMLFLTLAGVANLGISVMVAMFAVYIGIRLIDQMTTDVDEIAELKKGNVAIGIIMAAVLIAVAFVIRGSVVEIIYAIDLKGLVAGFY
ncbi:MAG: DUF350 domain-containing protein [Candidatus Micrarchaeota archaeon]